MSAQWRPISPIEATIHPLYGVKGWLLVFTIGNFLGPLLTLGQVNSIAFQNDISLRQLLGLDAPEIVFLKVAMLMELVLAAVVLFFLFTKNTLFRLVAIFGRLAFWPLLGLVALSQGISETGNSLAMSFFPWAVSCAVWVTYLQRSRRVRVTFEHCVREDEARNLAKPASAPSPYVRSITVPVAATTFEEHSISDVARSTASIVPQQSLSSQPSPSTIFAGIPIDEDSIYATVAEELESGKTDKGLWTRLFAECDGDEKQTRVAYIKRRVEKLMDAERARREQFEQEEAERQRQLAIQEMKTKEEQRSDAGLADSSLIEAFLQGNWATAKQILESGVMPFGTTDDGIPLRALATKRCDQLMLDLLTTYEMKSLGSEVSAAIEKFHAGTDLTTIEVNLLTEAAAKSAILVTMRSASTGYTLLHWCGRLGLDESAGILLDRGANAAAFSDDGKQAHHLTRSTALASKLAAAATAVH